MLCSALCRGLGLLSLMAAEPSTVQGLLTATLPAWPGEASGKGMQFPPQEWECCRMQDIYEMLLLT